LSQAILKDMLLLIRDAVDITLSLADQDSTLASSSYGYAAQPGLLIPADVTIVDADPVMTEPSPGASTAEAANNNGGGGAAAPQGSFVADAPVLETGGPSSAVRKLQQTVNPPLPTGEPPALPLEDDAAYYGDDAEYG